MLDHVLPEIIADGLGIPVCGVQKPLSTLRVRFTYSLGELPAILALYPTQQAEQVALCPMTGLRTGKTSGDPAVQLLESLRPSTDSIQLLRDSVLRHRLSSLLVPLTG